MNKVCWRGGALLAPLPPVMVTCKYEEVVNVITIGWTGILNTIPPKTYISVRPSRYSYELITKSREFVINLTSASLVRACDYCGVKSGKNNNKIMDMKLELQNATKVDVPMLADCPVNIECKVTDIVPLGSHDMFIADIVAVNVAEEFIDEAGKLHLDRANLLAYSHGEYFELGKKLGTFGFSVRKKKKKYKK